MGPHLVRDHAQVDEAASVSRRDLRALRSGEADGEGEGGCDVSDMMNNWRHKDEWRRNGTGFCVTVTCHLDESPGVDEGPYRWAVYAYIYPSHPHFANFNGSDMWQSAAADMPLHWYPSLLQYHRDDSAICSVQVGADYHHLHDAPYTFCADADAAYSVFRDADELFDWLDARKQQEIAA